MVVNECIIVLFMQYSYTLFIFVTAESALILYYYGILANKCSTPRGFTFLEQMFDYKPGISVPHRHHDQKSSFRVKIHKNHFDSRFGRTLKNKGFYRFAYAQKSHIPYPKPPSNTRKSYTFSKSTQFTIFYQN